MKSRLNLWVVFPELTSPISCLNALTAGVMLGEEGAEAGAQAVLPNRASCRQTNLHVRVKILWTIRANISFVSIHSRVCMNE